MDNLIYKKYPVIIRFTYNIALKKLAHAFEIDSFQLYDEPLSISDVMPSGTPPQSYCYLN